MIQKRIITNFNKSANTYNAAADFQAAVAYRLALHLPHDAFVQNVLEIGCGTGLFSQYLPDFFPNAQIILTDIASAMLNQCKRRLGLNQAKFVCTDGEALSFRKKFDLIFSCMAMHWFTDFSKSFLRITQNNLHPKGACFFAILGQGSFIEWRQICRDFNIPIGILAFPTVHQIKAQFPTLILTTQIIKKRFPNLRAWLTSLKLLGVQTTTEVTYRPLSKTILRRLLNIYNQEIGITYEVIYGEYRRL